MIKQAGTPAANYLTTGSQPGSVRRLNAFGRQLMADGWQLFLPPNVHHRPRRGHEAGLADVMTRFLLVDYINHEIA